MRVRDYDPGWDGWDEDSTFSFGVISEPEPEPEPVDTTPVDTTPVDTTPVDTTPVDTTPVDTTPVDTTPAEPEPVPTILPNGYLLRFNSYNFPPDYLWENNFEIWKETDDFTDPFMESSTFRARVPGFVGGQSMSFESVKFPGYYLYHDGNLVNLK
mmetsp:Transcript_13491/g.13227  ORF Transcript_13491/g.13227 Transcript_13491/m.13227 type:complete len:156 (+) Transcript_13491:558-1025(+)